MFPRCPDSLYSSVSRRARSIGPKRFGHGATVLALLVSSACSTLVGNVTPVDEKARSYGSLDLERENGAVWQKLPPDPRLKSKVESAEVPDVVFETKDHTTIISLNSACREIPASEERLPGVAQELTLGFRHVTDVNERWVDVGNGRRAFQKTQTGELEGRLTRLQVAILAAGNCVYDFSYISTPEGYPAHQADFDRFLRSLKFK